MKLASLAIALTVLIGAAAGPANERRKSAARAVKKTLQSRRKQTESKRGKTSPTKRGLGMGDGGVRRVLKEHDCHFTTVSMIKAEAGAFDQPVSRIKLCDDCNLVGRPDVNNGGPIDAPCAWGSDQ